MALYSKAEIEAFVDTNLTIVGEDYQSWTGTVRAHFVQNLSQLPPYQQALLIETRKANITGDTEAIQKMYSGEKRVNGFFSPAAISSEFSLAAGGEAIVWGVEARGPGGSITSRHEQGHRTDYQIGKEAGTGYWSDSHDGWKDALEKEKQRTEKKVFLSERRDPVGWINRQMDKLNVVDGPLYKGARELDEHLALFDNSSSHAKEALAEMTAHHLSLYSEYKGNEDAVDRKLTEKYPELWPVYRDEFLPAVHSYAQELIDKRSLDIENYVRQEREFCQAADKPFDEDNVRTQAGLLSAKAHIHSQTNALARQTKIYKNPVQFYIDAEDNLMELRWDIERTNGTRKATNPYLAEEEDIRQRATAILNESCKEALVLEVKRLGETRFALNAFERSLDRNARVVGEAFGHDPQYIEGTEVLGLFDELMNAGGMKAVIEQIKIQRTPGNELSRYVSARMNLEEKRWEFETADLDFYERKKSLFEFDVEVAKADIEAMRGPDMGKKLDAERLAFKLEMRALERLRSAIIRREKAIEHAIGIDHEYPPERDVLSLFDELKEQGGVQAALDKAETIPVPGKDLRAYVRAKMNHEAAIREIKENPDGCFSWGRKHGMYQPSQVSAIETSESFDSLTRDEIRVLLEFGGIEKVIEETEKMNHETHINIAKALGDQNAQQMPLTSRSKKEFLGEETAALPPRLQEGLIKDQVSPLADFKPT